jgi:hypothetical protein
MTGLDAHLFFVFFRLHEAALRPWHTYRSSQITGSPARINRLMGSPHSLPAALSYRRRREKDRKRNISTLYNNFRKNHRRNSIL